jgi:hypothetical protein
MTLEEYVVNRLTECEAENEDLRAANRTLHEHIRQKEEEDGVFIKAKPGTYWFTLEGKTIGLPYQYELWIKERCFVLDIDGMVSFNEIDGKRYFLNREKAEAKAKADQS